MIKLSESAHIVQKCPALLIRQDTILYVLAWSLLYEGAGQTETQNTGFRELREN